MWDPPPLGWNTPCACLVSRHGGATWFWNKAGRVGAPAPHFRRAQVGTAGTSATLTAAMGPHGCRWEDNSDTDVSSGS